ncbi:hypothetical protein P7C70_g5805, partial [Phenoliferia sp. Uapishka_3]
MWAEISYLESIPGYRIGPGNKARKGPRAIPMISRNGGWGEVLTEEITIIDSTLTPILRKQYLPGGAESNLRNPTMSSHHAQLSPQGMPSSSIQPSETGHHECKLRLYSSQFTILTVTVTSHPPAHSAPAKVDPSIMTSRVVTPSGGSSSTRLEEKLSDAFLSSPGLTNVRSTEASLATQPQQASSDRNFDEQIITVDRIGRGTTDHDVRTLFANFGEVISVIFEDTGTGGKKANKNKHQSVTVVFRELINLDRLRHELEGTARLGSPAIFFRGRGERERKGGVVQSLGVGGTVSGQLSRSVFGCEPTTARTHQNSLALDLGSGVSSAASPPHFPQIPPNSHLSSPPASPTKLPCTPNNLTLPSPATLSTAASHLHTSSNNHLTSTSAASQATQATISSAFGSGENFLGSTANALFPFSSASSVDSDNMKQMHHAGEASWEERVNNMLDQKLLNLHARFEDETRKRVELLHELEREEADRDFRQSLNRRFTAIETRLGALEAISGPTIGVSGGQSSPTISPQSTSSTKPELNPLYARGPVRAPVEASITGMRAEIETMKKDLVGLERSNNKIVSWKGDLTREMEGVNAQEVCISGEMIQAQITIKNLSSAHQTLEKEVDSRLLEKVSREDLLDAVCREAAEAVHIERKTHDSADPAQSITKEEATKLFEGALKHHSVQVASQLVNLRQSFDDFPTQFNTSLKSQENMETIKRILKGVMLDKMSLTNLVTTEKVEDLPQRIRHAEA